MLTFDFKLSFQIHCEIKKNNTIFDTLICPFVNKKINKSSECLNSFKKS